MDRAVDLRVTGYWWERKIEIEQRQALREGDWCEEMPSDAAQVSRERREHGTRRVADGEDCRTVRRDNGGGTYSTERECKTD